MNPTSQTRRSPFGNICKVLSFALLIQISTGYRIAELSNTFQAGQNIAVSHDNSNPDVNHVLPNQLSNDKTKLQIIETEVKGIGEVFSKQMKTFKTPSNTKPRTAATSPNSNLISKFISIENQINTLKVELSFLNKSSSLSSEDKSRIIVLQTTIKELQNNLKKIQLEDSDKEKKIQELDQKVQAVIFIGTVQSIQTRQFAFAEKQLNLTDDATYKKVVEEVYDHKVANFDLVLNFAEAIQNSSNKYKIYDALYYQLKTNDHNNKELLRLSQSLVKDPKMHPLFGIVWNENQDAAVEIILNSFLNDTVWPEGTQLSNNLYNYSEIASQIYNNVIEKIFNKTTISSLLLKIHTNNTISVEELVLYHQAVLNKLEHDCVLNTNAALSLARYMNRTMNSDAYKNIKPSLKSQYEDMKNKLPTSVKYIVFNSAICIKNSNFSEYLFAADNEHALDNSKRGIFTWTPKGKYELPKFKWWVSFIDDTQIQLVNDAYKERLYVESNSTVNNGTSHHVYTWRTSEPTVSESSWNLEVDGNGIQFKNNLFNEYLYADCCAKKDSYRREVFTFICSSNPLPKGLERKWEVDDCSESQMSS